MATTSRPYDPEEYSFGDFAEAMNNNATVDIAAANGTNAPVSTTPSGNMVADTVTPGQTTTSSFSKVLLAADSGETVQYESATTPGGTETSEVTTPGGTETSEVTTPEGTETPNEPTAPGPLDWIDTELGTFDIGTTETTGVTGTTGSVTGSDLSWLPSTDNTNKTSTDKTLDFKDWESAYSVDPVTEYKNAQAQLDYEYMTWMSTYGERAEQLFQMGLSNSGVSDIFGANAYSAYVQASIDLKRQQIQLQKQNKQEYQKYVDNIEAQKKADEETLASKISAGSKAYLESYTPEKAKQIYQALLAQGYSESEAAAVIQKLDNYYYATPEEDRPDTIESNSKVTTAYNNYSATYKPDNSQSIYNELVEVHGLTKQEAMNVIKKLQASYEANAPARFEADVSTATQWLNDNYYYGMTDEQIMSMLGAEYDEETVKAAMDKFAPYKNSIDALAGDEEASKAFNEMRVLISEGDTDIENLKAKIKSLGYSEAAIAKAVENIQPWLDEAIENQKKSNIDAATKWLNENYSYGMTDEELMSMLGTEYDEETVKAAMEKFTPYKNAIDRLGDDTAARNAFDYMLNALNGGDHDIESLKAKAKAYGFNENAIAKAAENIQPWINEALGQQETADATGAKNIILGQIGAGVTDLNELIAAAQTTYDDKAIESALKDLGVTKDADGNWVVDKNGYLGIRQAEAAAADEDEALTWLENNYQPGWDEAKLTQMLKSNKFSDEAIQGALERFKVFKTEVDLRAENEEFGEAFKHMSNAMSDGELNIDRLKSTLKSLGYSDAAIERAAEAIAPFLEEAKAEKFNTDVGSAKGALRSYMFSDKITDKAQLEGLLKDAGYSDDVIKAAMDSYDLYNGIYSDGVYNEEVDTALKVIGQQIDNGVYDVDEIVSAAKVANISDKAIEEILDRFGVTKNADGTWNVSDKGYLGKQIAKQEAADTEAKENQFKADVADAKGALQGYIFDGEITDRSKLEAMLKDGGWSDEVIAEAMESYDLYKGLYDDNELDGDVRDIVNIVAGQIDGGIYDVEEIVSALDVYGYDDATIEEVLEDRFGVTKNADGTWNVSDKGYLGKQIAKQEAAESEAKENQFKADVGSAYNYILDVYQNGTAKTEADLRALLENGGDLSKEVIDEAIRRFNNIKHIIDNNKLTADTTDAAGMILDAYLNGNTDLAMLQGMAESKYGREATLAAMNQLAYVFLAGEAQIKDSNTKLAFSFMLDAINQYDITDMQTLKDLAAAFYDSDVIDAAAELMAPWFEMATTNKNELATQAAMSWLDSNYRSGMTDDKLSSMLSSLGYSEEVIEAALGRFEVFKTEKDLYAEDEEFGKAFNQMYEFMSGGDLDIENLKRKLDGLEYSEAAIERAAEAIAPFLEEAQEKQAASETEQFKADLADAKVALQGYIFDGEITDRATLEAMLKDGGWSAEVIAEAMESYDLYKGLYDDNELDGDVRDIVNIVAGQIDGGIYDVEEIVSALDVYGYDDATIEEVLEDRFGITKNADGTWNVSDKGYLGKQIAKQEAAETEAKENQFKSDVGKAYDYILDVYQNGTAKTEADLRALLENGGDLSKEVIDEAIRRFNNVKTIIDNNKLEFNTNSAASMILQAYLGGNTDTEMLWNMAQLEYGKEATNRAMDMLANIFIAGQEKQNTEATKLVFNFMLNAMDQYEITDIQQLKDLAATLYGTDYLDDAAAMMEPWLKLGTDKLNEAKTESGVSMMLDMIANGESDMNKLKTYVAALLGNDVANAAAERLAPLASLVGEDVAKAQSQSAFAWMVDAYAKGTTDTELLEKMAKFLYGEDAVKAVSALFGEYVAADEKTRKDTLVFNAFEWMIDTYSSYDGDIDKTTLEKMATAIYGDKAIAKEASRKFEVFRQYLDGQGSASEDQLIYDAATMFGYNSDGEFSYTGSKSDKEFIKRMLNTSTYSMYKPYADKIIAQLDADLAGMKGAESEDVGGAFGSISENESWLSNPATSTMANYSATLEQYKQKYGVNSKEYKDVLAAGSASIKDYILAATDDVDKLEQAGSWLGVDFADMDDADRLDAMLDGAGELHKQGYLTDGDYGTIIDEWLKGEVGLISGKTSFFELSKIAGRLEEYLDSGYLNKSMYDEKMASIAKSVTLSSGQFVGNTTSTITTSDGESIPLTANVFMKVNANGASTSSSWSVSAMSVYGLYTNDKDASALEQKIKSLYGNVGAAVPMYYEGHVYFWSKSGDLYRANMDEAYFERDGRKETKDQAKWSKQLIEMVVKNNSK